MLSGYGRALQCYPRVGNGLSRSAVAALRLKQHGRSGPQVVVFPLLRSAARTQAWLRCERCKRLQKGAQKASI